MNKRSTANKETLRHIHARTLFVRFCLRELESGQTSCKCEYIRFVLVLAEVRYFQLEIASKFRTFFSRMN